MTTTLAAPTAVCPACYGPTRRPRRLCVDCQAACPYPPTVVAEPVDRRGLPARARLLAALAAAKEPMTRLALAVVVDSTPVYVGTLLANLVIEGLVHVDTYHRPWLWSASQTVPVGTPPPSGPPRQPTGPQPTHPPTKSVRSGA